LLDPGKAINREQCDGVSSRWAETGGRAERQSDPAWAGEGAPKR